MGFESMGMRAVMLLCYTPAKSVQPSPWWWFDSNKTKQNKKTSSKCFANLGLNIEGLFSFHCGIVRSNVRVFFFNFFFVFLFFFRKDSEK